METCRGRRRRREGAAEIARELVAIGVPAVKPNLAGSTPPRPVCRGLARARPLLQRIRVDPLARCARRPGDVRNGLASTPSNSLTGISVGGSASCPIDGGDRRDVSDGDVEFCFLPARRTNVSDRWTTTRAIFPSKKGPRRRSTCQLRRPQCSCVANMKVVTQLRINDGASKRAFICGNIAASIKSALLNVYPHRKFLLSEIVPTQSYPSAIRGEELVPHDQVAGAEEVHEERRWVGGFSKAVDMKRASGSSCASGW